MSGDLKKLSDTIKFNSIKTKVNNLYKKIPDATSLIHINQYNKIWTKNMKNVDKKIPDKKKEDADIEIPDMNGLVTTTVFDRKISEVENKILDTSSLVTITVLNTKISQE